MYKNCAPTGMFVHQLGMFEFRDRNWGTVCCVKLWDNYTIYKPQSACNKQTKKKTTE